MEKLIQPLEKMLASSDTVEQFSAAFPLVAMGHDAEAMPVVVRQSRTDLARRDTACWLLPWLPWEKRLAYFNTILNMEGGTNSSILQHLTERMVDLARFPGGRSALESARTSRWRFSPRIGRRGAADDLHATAERRRCAAGFAALIDRSAQGQGRFRSRRPTDGGAGAPGGDLPPDAATASNQIYQDSDAPALLRADAFHILLQSQQPDARQPRSRALHRKIRRFDCSRCSAFCPRDRRILANFMACTGSTIRSTRPPKPGRTVSP